MPADPVAAPGLLARLRRWLGVWSARRADAAWPDEPAEGTSAETVKEVVERKRRHERVRQREFDHLRQLRQRGIGTVDAATSQLSRWDSALSGSAQEREHTLRKIDQAEAQMGRAVGRRPGARFAAMPAGARAPALSDVTLQPEAGFAPTLMPAAAREPAHVPQADLPIEAAPPAMAPAPLPPWPTLPDPDASQAQAALRWACGADAAAPMPSSDVAEAEGAVPQLRGVLCGDIDAVLTVLAGRAPDAAQLEVGCAELQRVDFAAAGCLLDWAQAQQARGCRVRLRELDPRVAAFLHIVGLDAHVQLVPA